MHKLNETVYNSLHPAKLLAAGSTPDHYTQCTQALTIAETLRAQFMQQFYCTTKKEEQEIYIQHTQTGCTDLADRLGQYLATLKSHSRKKQNIDRIAGLYKKIQQQLLDLLDFISQMFPHHFNYRQKLPDHYRQTLQQHINNAKKLAGELQPLQLVLQPLQQCLDQHTSMDHNQYHYWIQLFTQLQRFAVHEMPDKEKACINLLIRCDFNDGAFLNYVQNYFSDEVNQLEDLATHPDKWAGFLRQVNKQHQLPGLAYNPQAPSCRQALKQFIKQEVQQANKVLRRLRKGNKEGKKPDFKIEVDLSVGQMGAFLRALKDSFICKFANLDQLFHQTALHCSLRNVEQCSPESIRTGYKTPNRAAVKILIEILNKVINQLKSYL